MNGLKLVLLGALAVVASACAGGESPTTGSRAAPLALWQGQNVTLAGTYDSLEGKLNLTADTTAAFESAALRMVRPGESAAITDDVELTVGDALDVVDGAGKVVGTLVVEDTDWVDSLDAQVRTAFSFRCATTGEN